MTRDWHNTYFAEVLWTTTPRGSTRHLKIRRHDGTPCRSQWDTLQQIKDDMLGPEAFAVEVYPARHDLVNETNTRHLFEVPARLADFGLHPRDGRYEAVQDSDPDRDEDEYDENQDEIELALFEDHP